MGRYCTIILQAFHTHTFTEPNMLWFTRYITFVMYCLMIPFQFTFSDRWFDDDLSFGNSQDSSRTKFPTISSRESADLQISNFKAMAEISQTTRFDWNEGGVFLSHTTRLRRVCTKEENGRLSNKTRQWKKKCDIFWDQGSFQFTLYQSQHHCTGCPGFTGKAPNKQAFRD